MRRLKNFFAVIGVLSTVVTAIIITINILSSETPLPGKRIGVIKVKGIIKDSEKYVKALSRLEDDENVKAIVLRVDSPGGVVGACQEIHDKVAEIAKKKPVVVSMGSVAASGGLYISAGATKIVANPGTITGSIGVIIQSFNIRKLAEKLGVEVITVKSGKYKDLLNPFKKPDPESLNILQSLINDSYEQFLKAVAEGRNLPVEQVRKFADGRVFTGRYAKEIGLVDYLGNFDKAVEIAKKLSKCPECRVWEVKSKTGILQKIIGEEGETLLKNLLRLSEGRVEETYLMYILN
ncbi:MAG: signal peptide peptidase SppA [Desulfurobacteriaceae bacterium]